MQQFSKTAGRQGWMGGFLAACLLVASLAGCAQPTSTHVATASVPAPACRVSALRPDVTRHWLDPAGRIRWPAHDGFTAAPVPVVLPAGLLIDRFGCPTGRFFSPEGATFQARALPYDCKGLPYTVYRTEAPLLAWTGKAAPWFDESGGATQFETDASAGQLLAAHIISEVPAAGSPVCPPD